MVKHGGQPRRARDPFADILRGALAIGLSIAMLTLLVVWPLLTWPPPWR